MPAGSSVQRGEQLDDHVERVGAGGSRHEGVVPLAVLEGRGAAPARTSATPVARIRRCGSGRSPRRRSRRSEATSRRRPTGTRGRRAPPRPGWGRRRPGSWRARGSPPCRKGPPTLGHGLNRDSAKPPARGVASRVTRWSATWPARRAPADFRPAAQPGLQLEQRLEHEAAARDLGVRQRQSLRGQLAFAEQQHVHVDRARAVANAAGRPAQLALDRLAGVEQLLRLELRCGCAGRR